MLHVQILVRSIRRFFSFRLIFGWSAVMVIVQMPKVEFRSNAKPSTYAPPAPLEEKKREEKERVTAAVLSITARAKRREAAHSKTSSASAATTSSAAAAAAATAAASAAAAAAAAAATASAAAPEKMEVDDATEKKDDAKAGKEVGISQHFYGKSFFSWYSSRVRSVLRKKYQEAEISFTHMEYLLIVTFTLTL